MSSTALTTTAGRHPRVHAFDDELARLDAVATIDALDAGELSVREVVAAAIERARAVNPMINAVAFERYEAALGSLPDRRRRGGFEGVPTFIKDMVPVAGLPMTWGSEALLGGRPAKRTRAVARDMELMGMAILGTSTMPEWGFTPSTEFPDAEPTRNPWNPDRTVGGSSGGAAALVASGVIPVGHGADGGGSIRIPAACAGLVGLKPTRGRLRRHTDEAKLPVAVTVDGIVTRSVRDTARWYAEMERVYRDRTLPPMGEVSGPPTRRLRIGMMGELPVAPAPDAPTRLTFEATASLLEDLGHHVEAVEPPVDPERFRNDFIAYYKFLAFMATRTARLTHGSHVRPERYTDFTRGLADSFRPASRQFVGAARRLRRSTSQVAQLHKDYDLMLSPVTTSVAPELGYLSTAVVYEPLLVRVSGWMPFTPLANAAGTPAISLPLGFDPDAGVPVGAMLSADHGEDALLLQIALELEAARPWADSQSR